MAQDFRTCQFLPSVQEVKNQVFASVIKLLVGKVAIENTNLAKIISFLAVNSQSTNVDFKNFLLNTTDRPRVSLKLVKLQALYTLK